MIPEVRSGVGGRKQSRTSYALRRKVFRDTFWERMLVARVKSSSVQIWNNETETDETHTHIHTHTSISEHRSTTNLVILIAIVHGCDQALHYRRLVAATCTTAYYWCVHRGRFPSPETNLIPDLNPIPTSTFKITSQLSNWPLKLGGSVKILTSQKCPRFASGMCVFPDHAHTLQPL